MATSSENQIIPTTRGSNLMVVEPDGVGTTGLTATGASYDAPARPTIEM
ncbi:TPA: hypothetical protein G8N97_001117 [Salmonella enterica]|uniref:Uncharacterized protein n=1 Tax=Salmonella enterica TaxID=28901 RepID=A0A750N4L7_SALER|nr:hypothetical protein [Salmonella enterica subsp. enterica serovar Java]EDX6549882.1 hypothetical protein [Salmonella enterica subsp. enterica]EEH0119318.1 hypothetical protein [Salmonella enterica]EEJ3206485.1 hypothetical protein [Salmonella enterica subsp. enterica serovar Java]HAF6295019.1 hypothetical protein [Salmonella enterica]